MALDDRDAKFEKALARHLHGAAQREACPDAEILSAYHERTLSPAELNSWKQHIPGCARCQDVLAQLEITEEIPLDVTQPHPIRQASTVQAINAKKGAGAARSRISLRWVVPAGAIAAGLLLWVTLHQRNIQDNGATPPVQIAQNRPEPKIVPEEAAQQLAPNEERRDQDASKLATPAVPVKPANSIASGKTALAAPKASIPLTGGERVEDQGASNFRAAAKVPGSPQSGALDKNIREADRQHIPTDAVQEQKKLEIAPAPAPPPLQVSQPSTAEANAGAPPAPAAATKQKAERATVATSSETVEVTSSFNGASALRLEAAQNTKIILAPNGKSVWRPGPAGAIEYSSNGGKQWTPQRSGVSADLVAGSAPSKKICWVVGRAGTILLTTDGGANWKQLTSPIADDLGGIQALDALQATIRDVPNARHYQTSDAGATWRSVPGE